MNFLLLTMILTAQVAPSKPDPARQPLDVREHIAITEKPALACRPPSTSLEGKALKEILTEGSKIELKNLVPLRMSFSRNQEKETISFRVLESATKTGGFILERVTTVHKDKDDEPLSKTTEIEIDEALSQRLIGFAQLLRPMSLENEQKTSTKVGILEPVTLGVCKSPKYDRFNRRSSNVLTKFDYTLDLEEVPTGAKQRFDLKNSMAAALLQLKEANLGLGTESTNNSYCVFQVQTPKEVPGLKMTPSLVLVDEALSPVDTDVKNALKAFEDFIKILDESK